MAKEVLYGEYDLDRIQKELLADSLKPHSDIAGSFNPGKQVIDRMMRQCREYQTQISRVKKDVTYTELQQEVLKDVENYNIRKMHDWVDFDIADLEVEAVTKSSKEKEEEQALKRSAILKNNGIIERDIRSLSQIAGKQGRTRLDVKAGNLSEHMSQNFSSMGGRLTSVQRLGSLRLKN